MYVSRDALRYMDSALAPTAAPFGVGAPDASYGFQPLLGPLAGQVCANTTAAWGEPGYKGL